MARLAILIWLLSSIGVCAAQTPATGRYGAELSIASDEQSLTGWLDRSAQMPQCRLYLHAKPYGLGWRVLGYAVDTDDLIVGTMTLDGRTLRFEFSRAPRGCEKHYRDFVEGPSYRLSQPRSWQTIALTRPAGARIRDRANSEATLMGELDGAQAWAVTEVTRGFSAGIALKRDGGEAGWVTNDSLAPPLATAAMRDRDRRPLPGLSSPATLVEREQWRQQLDWSTECEARFRASRSQDGGMMLIQIAPQFALLRINCAALSYQDSFVYAWIRLGAPEQNRLLLFPGFPADRGENRVSSDHSLVFGLDEIDVTTQTLLLFSKWRSAGDCGQLLRFDLRIDGVKLSEWRERSCEEEPPEETLSPLDWPLKNAVGAE